MVGVGGVRGAFAIRIVVVALKLEADAGHVLIRDHKMEEAIAMDLQISQEADHAIHRNVEVSTLFVVNLSSLSVMQLLLRTFVKESPDV